MELSFRPAVDDETERALRTALRLARVDAPSMRAHAGAWRMAALQEGVERDADADAGYAPSPRSTRGATRA